VVIQQSNKHQCLSDVTNGRGYTAVQQTAVFHCEINGRGYIGVEQTAVFHCEMNGRG